MNKRSSLEEYLEKNGSLTYGFSGGSMLPLLRQGRDLFTVRRKTADRCEAGDVILYRRRHRYVLHRIVKVRPEDYVVLGDNCVKLEYGIRDEDIIGVMTGFVRDGKTHFVDEAWYRKYTATWLRMVPVRIRMPGPLRMLLGSKYITSLLRGVE